MADAQQFERLKKINQKYRDIVVGYTREEHQGDASADPMPDLIHTIILLFYYQSLESSILSDGESDTLLSMFDEQNKFKKLGQYSFELIYSSKRDGNGCDNFKPNCENQENLLCLMHDESKGNGNVFGGYTKRGWKSDDQLHGSLKDKDAFIFSIRSSSNYPPRIFNCIKNEKAMYYEPPDYLIFGFDCAFWITKDGMIGGSNKTCQDYPHDYYLTSNPFKVNAVEVFQLKEH